VTRLIALRVVLTSLLAVSLPGQNTMPRGSMAGAAVVPAAEAHKLLPDAMFFQGKLLPVEPRNSEGILFPDGMYVLAALVDSSGHNTAAQGELGCLITEVPLNVNGHKLSAGVYGISLDHHRFVMMDIAAHRVFAAAPERDSILFRPRPLQIVFDPQTRSYRLYLERNYIFISRIPISTEQDKESR
jgi:hypothetical protein